MLALAGAELTLRWATPARSGPLGAISFQKDDGTPVADYADGVRQGLIVPVPGDVPRQRFMFRPGMSFFIAYSDNDVLQRDWLDAQGRVHNRINSAGVREREELVAPKPKGQRRLVCIGDSFTFGWGIPEEQNWVRLLERDLRKDGDDVRTVNCGAAGTVCVDEYVIGLEQRFARFEPDAVVLTICLNDLVGSDGLMVFGPPVDTGSRLLDLLFGALGRGPLELSQDRDWVSELLAMPEVYPDGTPNPRFGPDKPFGAMWSQGVPQKYLRRAKSWCDARGIPLMVVLWPFLQGLGPGRHYPFEELHNLVASDLEEAGIPLLDVTPQLAGTNQDMLWVTPADTHPTPMAQALVAPAISAFVGEHLAR